MRFVPDDALPQPQQREPLTEDEILSIAGYELPRWMRHHEEFEPSDLIDFARAIEIAQGIGAKP
jgi:hypothetical protein